MMILYYFVLELLNLLVFTQCVEYKHDHRSLTAKYDESLSVDYVSHIHGQLLLGIFLTRFDHRLSVPFGEARGQNWWWVKPGILAMGDVPLRPNSEIGFSVALSCDKYGCKQQNCTQMADYDIHRHLNILAKQGTTIKEMSVCRSNCLSACMSNDCMHVCMFVSLTTCLFA